MTEEEKLTKSGICPHCGSDNVVFGEIEFLKKGNYQENHVRT